jgi:hypothetical protein
LAAFARTLDLSAGHRQRCRRLLRHRSTAREAELRAPR